MLLGKVVYPYEYIDNWQNFKETTLHVKEEFHSNLNQEDITDADYMHEKRVNIMIHILKVIQLADVFKNFRKICFKNLSFRSKILLNLMKIYRKL